MWISTDSGMLLNLDRVTSICVDKLDTSVPWNDGTPLGVFWRGDNMSGVISRHVERHEAEARLAELYHIVD